MKKLNPLSLNTSLCNWTLDFHSSQPKTVRIRFGSHASSTFVLHAGVTCGNPGVVKWWINKEHCNLVLQFWDHQISWQSRHKWHPHGGMSGRKLGSLKSGSWVSTHSLQIHQIAVEIVILDKRSRQTGIGIPEASSWASLADKWGRGDEVVIDLTL